MNKIKLNKEIEINLPNHSVDGSGRLFYPKRPNHEAQGLRLKINELTPVSIVDCPISKIVFLTLLETAFSLIVWSGKYYDEAGEWTEEQVYKAAEDILNNSDGDFLVKLVDITQIGQYVKSASEGVKNSDPSLAKILTSLLPPPKQPIFPSLSGENNPINP